MSNYEFYAKNEFRAAGWMDENGKFSDEMQEQICNHVLKLLETFSDEGHSGTTAPYTLNLFDTLARFKPVTPLTGEDQEWVDISRSYGTDGGPLFQNKRCGSVFKDNNGAYNIDGKVFWEWVSVPSINDGKPFKSHFTSYESRVPVTFPYVIPEKSEYMFRPTKEFPNEELA